MNEPEQKVTPLELFFDLVFVFAFTQVTGFMSDKPTWEGLGQGMLILAALWWCWGAYAWLTDAIEHDEGAQPADDVRVHGGDAGRGPGRPGGLRLTTRCCSPARTSSCA